MIRTTKNNWLAWLKCNLLEVIILILVLLLIVKTFSVPTVDVTRKETTIAVQEQLPTEEVPLEVPITGGITAELLSLPTISE